MTYKQLLEELQALTPEQLDATVTIKEPYTDEYIAVVHSDIAEDVSNDVLDPGHYYLVLKA